MPQAIRIALVSAIALCLAIAPARADVAVNTFVPGGTFSGSTPVTFGGTPLPPPAGAFRFTVPWVGKVTKVELILSSTAPGDKVINIWTDGPGSIPGPGATPGTPIVGFTVPPIGTQPGIYTATASSEVTLYPGTTYWLIVRQIGAPVTNWFVGSTPGFWFIQNPFDGTWVAVLDKLPAVRIHLDAPGACCARNTSGVCVSLTRPQCDGFAGEYFGPATVCQPSPCLIYFPTGACCTGTGCSITSVLMCLGNFLGGGTVCQPAVRGATINACCAADFNNSGAVSTQDLFDFLGVFFGGCP